MKGMGDAPAPPSRLSSSVDTQTKKLQLRAGKDAAKAAKDATKLEATRKAVMKEFVTTERSFHAGLEKIVREFELPLREMLQPKKGLALASLPICKAKHINIVFQPVHDILDLSERMLALLDQCVSKYIAGETEHAMIGEIFVKM